MSTLCAEIIVKPSELWDYFQNHRDKLDKSMEMVAKNDEYDVIIYLENENNLPCLLVESDNIETTEYPIECEESCEEIASMVYELYLTEQIIAVVAKEDDEDELTPEEAMIEREKDINSFFLRLLEDLYEDDPVIYSDLVDDVLKDIKEFFLEYLYRKHNLSVYRPMELEDDEGVFVEDYPYECMEFAPNPLYDDKK